MATKKAIGIYDGQRKEIPALDMATVKPIVLYDNKFKELQAGDTIEGAGTGTGGFDDNFSINIKVDEGNETLIEDVNYAIALEQNDTNQGQIEALELKFPAGVYSENSVVPTDEKGFLIKVWLSGSTGTRVTNPTNANGENNAGFAVVSTAPGDSTPNELLQSNLGSNLGNYSFSSAIYRGFFKAETPIQTGLARVTAISSTGAFSNIILFNLSSIGGSTDFLSGSFTFDLFAAGINTIAKLQSLTIQHRTTDAIAGVTPAILTVDAGCLEMNIIL
jgi:hypothetical protein